MWWLFILLFIEYIRPHDEWFQSLLSSSDDVNAAMAMVRRAQTSEGKAMHVNASLWRRPCLASSGILRGHLDALSFFTFAELV
jgi:hypothetical protein